MILFLCAGAKAQTFVTIPDPIFVYFLQSHYPSCMSGNQMDVSCPAIQNDTLVNCSGYNIQDLTGIQYFINLRHLECAVNGLSSLPPLSDSLKYMDCSSNELTSLPALPNGLEHLVCYDNNLTAMPALNPSLHTLYCGYNQLSALPVSNFIRVINADQNLISTIPSLPSSILKLGLNYNLISTLPTLPGSLQDLDVNYNQLTVLPSLPPTLTGLSCTHNLLTNLPAIPALVSSLYCGSNQLPVLPPLSPNLSTLNCEDNQLSSLPPLPASLSYLNCRNNQLGSLPALPPDLFKLFCNNNLLTSLPVLPDILMELNCDDNQLTSLPSLPVYLELYCRNNNISCFPVLPLYSLSCFISGNPFSCLPNYVSGMDSATLAYPLCVDGDLVNNPNGCGGAQGIMGHTYADIDSTCVMSSPDYGVTNIPLKLYDASNNMVAMAYSFADGLYNIPSALGSYTVKLDTAGMPFYVQCAASGMDSSVVLSASSPLMSNINFDIACRNGFDIGVRSLYGFIFPGEQFPLTVVAGDMSSWVGLHCAAGVSGVVQLTVTGPVTYAGPAGGALVPVVAGNVFTYNVPDFGNVNISSDFRLLFNTDTSAVIGDTVCLSVTVTTPAGDYNPGNDTYQVCMEVNNSYDPNLKEVYPVNVEPGYQDWLTYTIHFQNTGNAPAMNIRLADTLDAHLDLETFEVINYSHYSTASLSGNALTFHFPHIMLPDSASDPEGSKGFVQYRIKPKAGLIAGTTIENTAYIYFDYNAPVVTNTTVNEFVEPLAVSAFAEDVNLSVYPNPGTGMYNVSLSGISGKVQKVEVYSLLGKLLLSDQFAGSSTVIDLSAQPKGIYILRLNGSLNRRLVKQ
ncbi:MAG: hypothetical protein JWO09_1448 [Bacteroidetes bacterium]|nr:hypothetical protein [Bacteroidota bacterium]